MDQKVTALKVSDQSDGKSCNLVLKSNEKRIDLITSKMKGKLDALFNKYNTQQSDS